MELDGLTGEELVNLSENTITGFRHDRSRLYKAAFDYFTREGNQTRKEEMRLEALAFDLSTKTSSDSRFGELMSGTTKNGETFKYPDPERDFPPEVIEYYRRRIQETNNPILKARYADIAWEFGRDFKAAVAAAEAYLECSDIYIEQGWDLDVADALTRSVSLALGLGNKELLQTALDKLTAQTIRLVDCQRFRAVLDFVETILNNYRKLDGIVDLEFFAEITKKATVHYVQQSDYHFERSFLQLHGRIRRAQRDLDAAVKADLQVVESYIREAEFRRKNYPGGNMVAASLYEEALKVLVNLGGFPDRVDELKVLIAECNRAAQATEYHVVSTSVNISTEVIEEHLGHYEVENIGIFLALMRQDPNLIPSWERAVEFAKEAAAEFPFQHFITKQVMRGDICVKTISGDQESIDYSAIQQFLLEQKYHSLILMQLFSRLSTQFGDYRDGLLSFLAESDVISPNRVDILGVAVERFYHQDYISATHIMVFQIEGILRDMLGKLGFPTFSYKNGEMRERTLTDILEAFKGINGFDADLWWLISICLNDLRGLNLRNEIAHGLFPPAHFTRQTAELLLFILVKILAYRIISSAEKDKMDDP